MGLNQEDYPPPTFELSELESPRLSCVFTQGPTGERVPIPVCAGLAVSLLHLVHTLPFPPSRSLHQVPLKPKRLSGQGAAEN